jgi:hypothetical protein
MVLFTWLLKNILFVEEEEEPRNVSGHHTPLEPLEADFLKINDLTRKLDPKTSGLGSFDELHEFFDDFLFYYHSFLHFKIMIVT